MNDLTFQGKKNLENPLQTYKKKTIYMRNVYKYDKYF